jgi:hypothetical protein
MTTVTCGSDGSDGLDMRRGGVPGADAALSSGEGADAGTLGDLAWASWASGYAAIIASVPAVEMLPTAILVARAGWRRTRRIEPSRRRSVIVLIVARSIAAAPGLLGAITHL